MAYQIDFTAQQYQRRLWRKWLLRLLFLGMLAGIAGGVHYTYRVYNQPTLNMKLAEYEAVARPIEEINRAWDDVSKEYVAMMRYYRLIWASNPTNLLEAMVADVRNKATGRASYLVSQVERSLADTRDAVAADKIKPIDAALDELKQTLEVSNHAVLTEEIALKQQNLIEAVEAVATNATSSVWLRLTDSLTGLSNLGSSNDAPILGRGFKPIRWTLKTGGECRLDYRYVFRPGDKAEQAKGIEAMLVNAVTSVVTVVEGKVEVQGVQLENLLHVNELNLVAKFALPDVKKFPEKEKALADCVNEIGALRKKVHETKIAIKKNGRDEFSKVNMLMMDYNRSVAGVDKGELPPVTNINVAGFFESVDTLVKKHEKESKKEMPGKNDRRDLRAAWDAIGEARWPWSRKRTLDNDELVSNTKILGKVSDGVKRFKGFLEQRRADCKKKIAPFIEAYDHDRVFNEPLIEADLKDRFAKDAGVRLASTTFKDEPNVEAARLDTADEKFTFTWVRWTLVLGGVEKGRMSLSAATGPEMSPSTEDPDSLITLEQIADCARRVLKQPGPGYVLDTIKINFDENGIVSYAVLEGLLPVKKVESLKPATRN